MSKKKDKIKRSILIEGLDKELILSKVTAVKLEKNMIHFDELDDGTWRLIYNSNMIPDLSMIEGFKIIRE